MPIGTAVLPEGLDTIIQAAAAAAGTAITYFRKNNLVRWISRD